MTQLIPPRFLFRWMLPVRQKSDVPRKTGRLLGLSEDFRLPSLAELEGKPDFAEIRMAWNAQGLGISVDVRGRSRRPKCLRESPIGSDGLQVWIDTRNVQSVHRATKYCHRFAFLPLGAGPKGLEPLAAFIPLANSREASAPLDISLVRMQSTVTTDGYEMDIWIPATVLNGFAPATQSKLGFHFLVSDSELGEQSLAVGHDFPVSSDPSLWQTIELVPSA